MHKTVCTDTPVKITHNKKWSNGMTHVRLQPLAVTRGYDIAKLARRADLGYRTVFDLWHDPSRNVTLDTLDKIAAALDMTVLDLLTEGQA